MEFENKYFAVKPIVNGFEMVMVLYGEEDDIKKYIEYVLRVPSTYTIINERFARNLFDIGFKIYMCPPMDKIDIVPTDDETEKEEVEE